MKKKTKAIISLALASTIAITVAGCSAKDKQADSEYVNSSSQEQTVTNSNGEIVTADGSETTNSTADSTTAKKTKKAKKVKEKPTKPYYVTNINGNKISTTAPNNNNDKNASTTTTQKGETTTKHYEGTTTYTTRPSNAPIELPALPEEDYVLSDSMALSNLQVNYPEKWINYFYDYDPNNKGDRAYFAVFTNPDKHTITSVITVDLKTGKANERDLKTGVVSDIKAL